MYDEIPHDLSASTVMSRRVSNAEYANSASDYPACSKLHVLNECACRSIKEGREQPISNVMRCHRECIERYIRQKQEVGRWPKKPAGSWRFNASRGGPTAGVTPFWSQSMLGHVYHAAPKTQTNYKPHRLQSTPIILESGQM